MMIRKYWPNPVRSYTKHVNNKKDDRKHFEFVINTVNNNTSSHCIQYNKGDKVWIVVRDKRTLRYSIDYDIVDNVDIYGSPGSGNLRSYWLTYYGAGYGLDFVRSLFPTKTLALLVRDKVTFLESKIWSLESGVGRNYMIPGVDRWDYDNYLV